MYEKIVRVRFVICLDILTFLLALSDRCNHYTKLWGKIIEVGTRHNAFATCLDSQVALKNIVLWETGKHNKLSLLWAPGYQGNPGNAMILTRKSKNILIFNPPLLKIIYLRLTSCSNDLFSTSPNNQVYSVNTLLYLNKRRSETVIHQCLSIKLFK